MFDRHLAQWFPSVHLYLDAAEKADEKLRRETAVQKLIDEYEAKHGVITLEEIEDIKWITI